MKRGEKMKKEITTLCVLMIVATLILGCSSEVKPSETKTPVGSDIAAAETKSGSIVDITINSFNFGFTATPATINKGDKVRLKLTSTNCIHGIAIPGFGISVGPVSPGEEKTVEFIADKSGSFDYFCNVPCGSGHRSMRGTLTVN
jgi:cytochrome c oxidase subunit 2